MRKEVFAKSWSVWLIALVVVFMQAGEAWSWFGSSKKKVDNGMMPQFVLSSAVAGPDLKSNDLQGKVLLINFWATWCGPCVEEYPDLMRLHETFVEKGFSVIGISTDQSKSSVRKFVEKNGHVYPMVMSSSAVTRDFGAGIGLPVSFLVDRKGKIVKRYYGPRTLEQFSEDVKGLL
ncbi:MAG: TlpA disulfide reductase family protein [Thermodesulfobacteriota bacterium]